MTKALISPPAALPVTLAAAKAHLRVETDDDDEYIGDLIAAATAQVEAETGKALIAQTWRVYLDDWPDCASLTLPVAPVRSVEELRVFDADGEPQTVEGWTLDAVSDPPRLLLGQRPLVGQPLNGIEIDVEAGFGEAATDVPDTLRRAILVLVAHWYELRGAAADAALVAAVPPGFARLIAPFRRPLL